MRRAALSVIFILLLPLATASARTWWVIPGGTGDALTIQAGIDLAGAGDTVVVECGTYYEHEIVMKDSVYLASETGGASCVVIDAQGLGRVMLCDSLSGQAKIDGFTLTGGSATGTGHAGSGGGMACLNYSSPFLSYVYFVENSADHMGGGLFCGNVSSPSINFCHFVDNEAGYGGGGLASEYYSPASIGRSKFQGNTTPGDGGGVLCDEMSWVYLSRCTLVGNAAGGRGGGLCASENSDPNLVRCLIAFSTDGEGVYATNPGSDIALSCCDVFGNADGDWVDSVADQENVDGNFGQDPLLCDITADFLYVEACSPCVDGYHPYGHDCGSYIGASPAGCQCGEATEPATWGTIKAIYR